MVVTDRFGRIVCRSSSRVTSAALVLTFVFAMPASAADRVLVVSWDGVRRDTLHELLDWQGGAQCPAVKLPVTTAVECGGFQSCLPSLCTLSVIDSEVAPGKPLTRPQHASMLSGYSPATAGVERNLDTWLAIGGANLGPAQATVVDVTPTIYDLFGVPLAYDPPLEGISSLQ